MIVCIYVVVYECNNIENDLSCIMLFTKAVLGALKNRVLNEIGRKFLGELLEPFFEERYKPGNF